MLDQGGSLAGAASSYFLTVEQILILFEEIDDDLNSEAGDRLPEGIEYQQQEVALQVAREGYLRR
jgi:hypothetical protein